MGNVIKGVKMRIYVTKSYIGWTWLAIYSGESIGCKHGRSLTKANAYKSADEALRKLREKTK